MIKRAKDKLGELDLGETRAKRHRSVVWRYQGLNSTGIAPRRLIATSDGELLPIFSTYSPWLAFVERPRIRTIWYLW